MVWVDPSYADELLGRPLTVLHSERRSDGSLIAEIDLESAEQALRFALSCGRRVVVRGPHSLREAVTREIVALAMRYDALLEREPAR
jgi:predicted DNA-binding transcriptional regulator YafY